jgi:uncharacterized membrane protein YqjE
MMANYNYNYNDQRQYESEPSLGELFSDLSAKAGLLVTKEVALAKAEMSQKVKKAGREITLLVIAGALGNAALLILLAGIVLALGVWIPYWAAAFIVGGVLAISAAILAWTGVQSLKEINPVPSQTMQTLREDKEWLTAQMN